MHWLEEERPELVDGYRQLYTSKYAPTAYRAEVKKILSGLMGKYAVTSRDTELRRGEALPRPGPL
jgi:hypothetical protein